MVEKASKLKITVWRRFKPEEVFNEKPINIDLHRIKVIFTQMPKPDYSTCYTK